MQRQDTYTPNYQVTLAQAKLKNETFQNYIGNFVAHSMEERLKKKNDERMTKINMLEHQIQYIKNTNPNLIIEVII